VKPNSGGAWLGEWAEIEEPEQNRYTADIIIMWENNLPPDDHYLFIPALRRSIRLSDASHCAATFSFDNHAHDDSIVGWNRSTTNFRRGFVRASPAALTSWIDEPSYDMPYDRL
jgi:hypothetical protein